MANVLGRLDPKTGQIKEFALKTPDSGPHGLAEDKAGNIWYTGNSKALIGKLDPKTGQVTEYPMPDPAAKDPHSLMFDQKGTLWFTVQGANMVGRLNPATGELTLRNSPTTKSLPYGIMVNSKGVPFFVEFGANKVASIDPASMVIREWTLPDPAARPRRLAIDAQDNVWYSDYARGLSWPARSGDVASEGMGVAGRSEIAAVRHRRHRRQSLVQRVRRAAEYDRHVRSGDGEIPDVADPVRRRSRAERQRHQGRQPRRWR